MTKKQDPDPLFKGMDPRIWIRIHTKISWIRNTAQHPAHLTAVARGGSVPAWRWTPVLPLARRHVQAVPGPVQDQLDLVLVRTLTHKLFI